MHFCMGAAHGAGETITDAHAGPSAAYEKSWLSLAKDICWGHSLCIQLHFTLLCDGKNLH